MSIFKHYQDGNRDAQLKSEINSEAKVGFNSKEKANVETVKPDTRVAFEIKSEFGQRFMATQKKFVCLHVTLISWFLFGVHVITFNC